MAGSPRDTMHPVDAEMLARLGAIVDVVDPVPLELVEMGRGLFAFRDPDAALMAVIEADDLAGAVRSGWPSRMHFFEFGEVSLDVELTVDENFCAVLGVLTSGTAPVDGEAWAVNLETTASTYSTTLGDGGDFAFAAVPLGMIRFHLDRGDDVRMTSPWIDAA